MSVTAFNNSRIRLDGAPRFILRQATSRDAEALFVYLDEDPWTNLFVRTRVEVLLQHGARRGAESYVVVAESAEPRRPVHGLCLISHQLAMPVVDHDEAARAFGDHLRAHRAPLAHIVGQRRAAASLWSAYGLGRDARLNRAQRYYVLEHELGLADEEPPLYKASLQDLEQLTLASAAMHLEETYIDPLTVAPDSFRLTVRQRILDGRSFVWLDSRRRVVFKADISCMGRHGVLVSGVYTRSDMRRQGVARRGMSLLCRRLLRVFSSVALYVNEGNTPAIRLYESLGFRYHRPYRTVFIDH
ncbi:MAG: hypothetical protein CMH57_08010 [Myxococcales bacterium]|nr:hypothetical protein [Myxococcales bacterium]